MIKGGKIESKEGGREDGEKEGRISRGWKW